MKFTYWLIHLFIYLFISSDIGLMKLIFTEQVIISKSAWYYREIRHTTGSWQKGVENNETTTVSSQATQAQCVSLIINTCSFILRNLKWPRI